MRAILIGLFVVAWATTFNAAVMCGDDVTHFHASYGNEIYWPDLSWRWIPNRVFDLYARNLTAELFDALYFPSHALTGVGFFVFYKGFSATMFAVFVCGVYWYLRLHLPVAAAGLGQAALLDVTLAAAVLLVLPWTNQVRLLCYEVPAFLSFMVLVELTKMLQAGFKPDAEFPVFVAPQALVVLCFVAAFSLEAYAAIMLAVLLMGAGMALCQGPRRFGLWAAVFRPGLMVALSLAAFCGAALLIAVFVATRGEDVHRGQALGWLNIMLPAIGVALVIGIVAAGRRTQRFWVASGMAALFVMLLAASLIVVGLISFEADQNYFAFGTYPWGGLTLMLQLMAVLLAGLVLAPSQGGAFWLQAGRMFVLFIIASRVLVAVLSGQASAAQKSDLVAAAYAQMTAGANGIVQTGLSLDAIPLQERPLPTADSPGWFIRNYHGFFEKYYGVDFNGTFE